MCRQRAGCNPGTAKADGQTAWWKLPRGTWRVWRVLSVWSLTNECPNRGFVRVWRLANGDLNALTTEGHVQAKGRLQPWNSKGWRPEGLVEAAARDLEGFKSFKCLKPGKRMPQRRVLRVWKVWRLANGKLERANNRGLCAGKGQAATLEQQRLTARGLGGSCREGSGGSKSCKCWNECPNGGF